MKQNVRKDGRPYFEETAEIKARDERFKQNPKNGSVWNFSVL